MDPTTQTPTRPAHYATLSAAWAGLLGTVLAAARDEEAGTVRSGELVPLGLATFALAKLVAKEKVDAWVREPFVDERPDGDRRPKGDGLRYAVGELLTCTRCAGLWSALGIVGLRITRPREARVITTVLAASAINDWTQSGFTWLCARSNAAGSEATRAEARARRAADGAGVG